MKKSSTHAKGTLFEGLSTARAEEKRRQFGKNQLNSAQRNYLLESLLHLVKEPMFLLLAVACVLYFILGDTTEAVMMLVSIVFVAGIEIFQETKSEKALDALRKYTEAQVRVLRDGQWQELLSEDLVPDDVVSIGEGERVPADGLLLHQHDLSVEEAVLTGESLPVDKRLADGKNQLFQGTTVASGQGVFKITATGNQTELGKLGKSIENIDPTPTPLQVQIERFVRQMGIFGLAAFALVFVLNILQVHDFWKALLFSLTVAMALLPEEIPVAFTTFMALGSFRMSKLGILAKQPKTVESLGSATVICLDKTGTITENRMSVAETMRFDGDEPLNYRVLEYAWWASEPEPIDAMEKAVREKILESGADPRHGFHLVHEYPLGGVPPMMTHLWMNKKGERIVACKGAVERILTVCKVAVATREQVMEKTEALALEGCRILGVASASVAVETNGYPADQDDFNWHFEGIIAFFDPPKENVGAVLKQFYQAGIRVMMITGDHAATAKNIAKSVGLKGWEVAMTGQEVMALDDFALRDAVGRIHVFARMFPDAKLKVVEALKTNGETVAMSGDGVNDGPALKSAQIGVAMGAKGADIAKQAASLVLIDDNLQQMVAAIAMGRRIYNNLRKAIRYIISIHLPIIVAVLAPLLLGWEYPHIFLPLHVIFLELVMDPMAAIGFENEPAEPNILKKAPRKSSEALFSGPELALSLLQGLMIGGGVLVAYQFAENLGHQENTIRAYVFTTIVLANLFLTLANRSFDFPLHKTIFYPNPALWKILAASLLMLGAVIYIPVVAALFKINPLTATDLAWCLLFAFCSVAWFEIWKWIKNLPQVRPGKQAESRPLSPSLVLISGLPGTGKSTVAKTYAQQHQALHLNSDLLRHELGQLGKYQADDKRLIYEALLERTKAALQEGREVVVDATFYREALREPFRQLAADTGARVHWIELTAPESLIRERVSKPRPDSEADFAVYQKLKTEYEPLPEAHLRLSTSHLPPETLAAQIRDFVVLPDP